MSAFKRIKASDVKPKHFGWKEDGSVATITIDITDRKNPLTFDSYAELRDTFRDLQYVKDVTTVVLTGAGGNFCSGGDVNDIIGPLFDMGVDGVLEFNQMAGDLVKAMRHCPQPIVAAIDGICVGAGAILAMASDLRYGTPNSKVGFLFVKVGLPACDMGACNMLPRIVGHGRAADLLYTGRLMGGEEAYSMGFYNGLCESDAVLGTATAMAQKLSAGPTFANAITKRQLHKEWDMGIDEAIDSEGQAMAIAMYSKDFRRAYEAFTNKKKPEFQGD